MWTSVFALPLPLLAFSVFVLLTMAEWLGCRLRARFPGNSDAPASDLGNIQTSVFALLGLLIAFTFGLALDRYETRRDMVIQEANAIGTAHIRTAFSAEPVRTGLRTALEDYARHRLSYGRAEPDERLRLLPQAAQMRAELAKLGVTASENVSSPPLGPALIDSINTVIDIGGEREANGLAHVPASVAWLLLSYAAIAAVLLGYSRSGQGRPLAAANALLLLLLTLALAMIADLDRPASGTITVSQFPMEALVAGF